MSGLVPLASEQRVSLLTGDFLACCIVGSMSSPDHRVQVAMQLNTKQSYLSLVPNAVPKAAHLQ